MRWAFARRMTRCSRTRAHAAVRRTRGLRSPATSSPRSLAIARVAVFPYRPHGDLAQFRR